MTRIVAVSLLISLFFSIVGCGNAWDTHNSSTASQSSFQLNGTGATETPSLFGLTNHKDDCQNQNPNGHHCHFGHCPFLTVSSWHIAEPVFRRIESLLHYGNVDSAHFVSELSRPPIVKHP